MTWKQNNIYIYITKLKKLLFFLKKAQKTKWALA